MSVSNRMITSIRAASIPMENIGALLKRPGVSISVTPFGSPCGAGKPYDYGSPTNPRFALLSKGAVAWKGLTEGTAEWTRKAPEGVKSGLQRAKSVSRACAGVTGVVIDPETGNTCPRKGVVQRERAGR